MWDPRVSVWLLVCTARQGRTCWGRLAPSLSEFWPITTFPVEQPTYRLLYMSGVAASRHVSHHATSEQNQICCGSLHCRQHKLGMLHSSMLHVWIACPSHQDPSELITGLQALLRLQGTCNTLCQHLRALPLTSHQDDVNQPAKPLHFLLCCQCHGHLG